MNKVVLTGLAMSAVLVLSACSSSGSSRHNQGGHSSYKSCPTCGPGSYSVQHGHRSQGSGGSGGSGFVKVAGALLVGGLIYNALDDDDSSGSHAK